MKTENRRSKVGLELSPTGKHDKWKESFVRKIEDRLNRFQVSVVLPERILELPPCPVDNLCPVAMIRISEDPATIVLGFDDKHPGVRHKYVINLCSPGFGLKSHVVQQDMRSSEPHDDSVDNQGLSQIVSEEKATSGAEPEKGANNH